MTKTKKKLKATGKGARRAQRKQIGRLTDNRVQPRTRQRYREAVAKYMKWLEVEGKEMPSEPSEVEETVCDYIEDLWESGETRRWAGDVLSGLQFEIKALKGHLKEGWTLLGVWQKNEPPTRAIPMSREQAEAMAGEAMREKNWGMAAAYMAGFTELLRPIEIVNILAGDCVFNLEQGTVIVNLGFTKSGKRKGAPEKVVCRDETTTLMLALVLEGRPAGTKLVQGGMASFRMNFASHAAKIRSEELRPYSLRRGGATYMFGVTGNMSKTTEKGRWANVRTARIYIDEAGVELARKKVSVLAKLKIKLSQKHFRQALSSNV